MKTVVNLSKDLNWECSVNICKDGTKYKEEDELRRAIRSSEVALQKEGKELGITLLVNWEKQEVILL